MDMKISLRWYNIMQRAGNYRGTPLNAAQGLKFFGYMLSLKPNEFENWKAKMLQMPEVVLAIAEEPVNGIK